MSYKTLKLAEYYKFVEFMATPDPMRIQTFGYSTQIEFQKEHKVSGDTLARWKYDTNFKEDVRRKITEWSSDKTPNVIANLYNACTKKNPDSKALKLWLQYVEGFSEKTEEKKVLEVGDNLASILLQKVRERQLKENGNDTIEGSI